MQLSIKNREMTLVTYGCGDKLSRRKFKPIENDTYRNKPDGGLWTSPYRSKWGWRKWGKVNQYGDFKTSFKLRFEGMLAVVDSKWHMDRLPWTLVKLPSLGGRAVTYYTLDFKKIADIGVDGIHLTVRGEQETRYSMGRIGKSLYGWDCETVLLFNLDCVTQIK
jgi:hypothetical protein